MLPPFNIDLLVLEQKDLAGVPRIEVLDIFDGVSQNFHPKGLFSSEYFGRAGEEKRNRLFGYIDLKIEVFHPLIFKLFCNLKSLYSDIMNGKEYAIFDSKIKDFVKSDPIVGKTGFAFFIQHHKDIKFEERPSDKRETSIKVVNKYRDQNKALMSKIPVMPAGFRDYIIDSNGKPSEDDINKLYRKVLSTANMVSSVNKSANPEYLDSMRLSLQVGVMAIYDYIMDMLDGKNKFTMGKLMTRKIYRSTRNVITTYVPRHTSLKSPRLVSLNQTGVGLHQFVSACLPLVSKHLKDGIMGDIFTGPNTPAILVNPKTLKKEMVMGIEDEYDSWMTLDGLEKIVEKFELEELKHKHVMIKGMYAALIYKGKDNTFKVFQDIDALPEGYDKSLVTPLTMAELFYLTVYPWSNDIPCTVTRYPISGYGSMYPSMSYLITTNNSLIFKKLDDSWNVTEEQAIEFPIYGEPFFNSICPSPSHIQRAGAD